jgi:hypothetical protein
MATFGQFVQLGPINEETGGGWKLYHYSAGTSTLKDVWTDRDKSTTAAQPVVADGNGIMSFFADGLYRFQVFNSDDELLYTWDNVFYGSLESTNHAEGNALSSASTLVLGEDGDYFHVTGTNTISSIQGTQPFVFLTFDSSLTLTHSSTLVLKGAVDHITTASETLLFVNDGNNVFREVDNNVPTKNADNTWTGSNTFSDTVTFNSPVTFNSTATIGDPALPTQLSNKRYADQTAASGFGWSNFGFSTSVSSNALTVSLLTYNASTPSTDNSPQISIPYTGGGGSASDNVRTLTGATTITLSAGSTLGFTANQISRIYVVAIDNSGSVEVGLYHPLSGTNLIALNESKAYNTTAEGGSGGADSAQVIYTTTARTSVSIRVVGWIEIQTGATAGNWSNAPISSKLLGSGMPRTGTVVQRLLTTSSAKVTGATAIPSDDTIPQNTEGTEMMTASITPQSSANLLIVAHVGYYTMNSTASAGTLALFKDSGADAIAAVGWGPGGVVNAGFTVPLFYQQQAGGTSAITYKLRAGNGAGTNVTLNGAASTDTRLYGGVAGSALALTEVFV